MPGEVLVGAMARLPLFRRWPAGGYAGAVVFSALALGIREAVDPLLPPGFPFVTFFPAVIATAFLFGLRPAIVAAVAGAILSNYFFIAPFHGFSLRGGAGMAMALYVFVVVVDIVLVELMQRAFGRLATERERSRRLADHREVLFRELQHRVGNNLQMVASLLAIQRRKVAQEEAATALDEASRRIGMIGRIQRQLYDPSGQQDALGPFIAQIARDLVETCGREGIVLTVAGGDDIAVAPDAAIPLALMVAEALSNSIEHGFAERDSGRLHIGLEAIEGQVHVTLTDDGAGLPEQFDPSSASLGLRLARTLAAGAGGTFQLDGAERGVTVRIVMPQAPPVSTRTAAAVVPGRSSSVIMY